MKCKMVVALGAALMLCAPATANAAVTASVTGDNGVPVQLVPGAVLPLTNMDVRAYVHVDPAADAASWQLAGHRRRRHRRDDAEPVLADLGRERPRRQPPRHLPRQRHLHADA